MNAKSERASLPDRVEAARVLYEVLEAQGMLHYAVSGWDNRSEYEKNRYRRALAAADACEAERNPRRTIQDEAQMFADEVRLFTRPELVRIAALYEVPTPPDKIFAELRDEVSTARARCLRPQAEPVVRMGEAERNPNTGDDEREWIANDDGSFSWPRRPVSSEDVHREAAE